MWHELETAFNHNEVTKMENDLEAEKLNLTELYNDTQGYSKVRVLQKGALDEQIVVADKLIGKESGLLSQFRIAK